MDDSAKPRLLVLASTYPRWRDDSEPGFVHQLCLRLTRCFDVTALVPDAPGAEPDGDFDGVHVIRYRYAPRRLQALVNDGGIVTNLRRAPWKWLLLPGFVLACAWRTWRLLHTYRPGVVHAHWLLPQGLVAAALSVVARCMPPFLVTSHGADLFALRSLPMQALKRFVARHASGITVVSMAMREELARIGVDVDKVAIQPMGVDLGRRFTPDAGVNRSRNEILFVGRMVEKKGLRYLIEAMPAVLARRPNAFLNIVGFGPEEGARRAQVVALGLHSKVNFLGAATQAELPEFYRRAAVFVAPFVEAASGDQDGLGLVVVEAAGCGCPVVVSDLPAVRQVFPAATSAHRVASGNSSALAAAIVEVLDHPEEAQSEAHGLIASLRARFDWETIASGYAELLTACSHANARHAD